MKPLIFLDVDGVLNTPATRDATPITDRFDLDKIARLSAFAEEIDADIVISSSWRRHYPVPIIARWMETRGLQTFARVVGATPILDQDVQPGARARMTLAGTDAFMGQEGYPVSRGQEIRAYLLHEPLTRPFIIFDDNTDFDATLREWNHVRTYQDVGLTDEDIQRARVLLREQSHGC